MVRRFIKVSLIFGLVLCSVVIAFLTDKFVGNRRRKLVYFSKITSIFSKIILRVLSVKVYARNYENFSKRKANYLIVSNHLSYIDVFAISSLVPATFIASVDEVRDRFLLGTLAKFGGSVFVNRKSRARLTEEIEIIADVLRDGINVVLFPEGTTSNGDRVLSFKTPLLTPSLRSNIDILPICMKYLRVNREDLNSKNRDLVFYYGDMTFFRHFWGVLSLQSVEVELIALKNIKANENLTRKQVAELAFNSISLAYR
ncbi:MAG TPA: lysophospholipid acyltransferase family protein [Thermodesulfobacteriota bacterium]|nr:lysophospholipid acyltransferase family protein [Thermodesulfobacteriota bacterium]